MSSDKPQIVTDEDWKERVRAENRALDEALQKEQAAGTATESRPAPERRAESAAAAQRDVDAVEPAAEHELPPADLVTLVTMLSTQALVGLGLLPHPASGKPEPNRALARHFIDLLGVVEEKTRGNLSSQENKLLDATLYDLRMTFVRMPESSST